MRAKLGPGLAILLGLAVPGPLLATFHEVKIVQVFGGTVGNPDAQYVMLQMWAAGQNLVGGHALTIDNGDGTPAATLTFPAPPDGNLAHGESQSTFRIGTAAAARCSGRRWTSRFLRRTPDDAVTRDAMAKFLTTALHLLLYGP